ncbi:MAG: hypothetical protein D3906_17425, partial [Candidatus Electrothrix sp. AUS1_2]|nr:hypothetical protein [Candidatus Electrothrix sp. AUS1_2]
MINETEKESQEQQTSLKVRKVTTGAWWKNFRKKKAEKATSPEEQENGAGIRGRGTARRAPTPAPPSAPETAEEAAETENTPSEETIPAQQDASPTEQSETVEVKEERKRPARRPRRK